MFESFTASAERAMLRADLLAKRRRASIVEPLDLLAALAAEPETRASELLVEWVSRLTDSGTGSARSFRFPRKGWETILASLPRQRTCTGSCRYRQHYAWC